eukprot:TRINITY_DN16277_c0_g1_i1.p1 TRINITY_DN16277_c0_g1~~TRINITY_DN16277_c0_g1_i1.p1  ORF type:complete len:186 (-),score=11.70 TRINITY_DN16277_c0_g1_i1:79-636(-)
MTTTTMLTQKCAVTSAAYGAIVFRFDWASGLYDHDLSFPNASCHDFAVPAISADGSTIVVGCPGFDHSAGAAWLYTFNWFDREDEVDVCVDLGVQWSDKTGVLNCSSIPHCQECAAPFGDISPCEWCLDTNSCTSAGDPNCVDFVSTLAYCPAPPYPNVPCSAYTDCDTCLDVVTNGTCEWCLSE